MKTSDQLILGLVLPLLASCSTGQEPVDIQPDSTVTILTATTEAGAATRTTLDQDYTTVLWMPKESISVFRSGKMASFTSENEGKVSSTNFFGTLPEASGTDRTLYGLYPYDADAVISNGVITTSLPAGQAGTADTFADGLFISAGHSESNEMDFFNACSGIRFQLDRNDIRRVTFLANGGEPLAGRFSIGFDGKLPVIRSVSEGFSEVTLTAPADGTFAADTWYYLVTLPGSLEKGYTILLEGDDVQGTVRSSEPFALNRNKFRSARLEASRVDYKTPNEYDIENAGARAYLEEVDYSDDPDYTRTEVAKYAGKDKPLPVKLSWSGKADVIRMSTNPDLSDAWEISVTTSPASVYNLHPGKRYFYAVVARDGSTLKESCVIPKGPLRMVYGVSKNVRDLGGWKCGDKRIRYGRLYRGARLDDIQSKPAEKDVLLNTLKVDIDLDLRGLPPGTLGGSGEKNPWTTEDPITYVNIQLWHYFTARYRQYDIIDISEGASADVYQKTIRTIIGWLQEDKVVYFHCHGGSDRTGTLAFLIEALMGVSEEDLSKDYELTYFSGSDRRRTSSTGWNYKAMIKYIRTFAPGRSIGEQVTTWAKTRFSSETDPLSDAEIEQLKALLLE